MGTRIEKRFEVRAPPSEVWAFLVDPRRVVRCLPGAELAEVVDERTFRGSVKVKVGPATVSYQGRVSLVELDEEARRVRMVGEGREGGGAGAARMAMESQLTALPGGGTEVTVVADVDLAGRIVQLGRGMVEQVSQQLFEQFAACVRATLEPRQGPSTEGGVEPPPPRARPVRAIPLLFTALWALLVRLLRRLAGQKPGPP